jgi:DNA-binding NarL/FixJ family response regulator
MARVVSDQFALVVGEIPSNRSVVQALVAAGLDAEAIPSANGQVGLRKRSPSVVLLVLDSAEDLLTRVDSLVKRFEPAPIVVISADIERWEVRAALTSGASGVVLLDCVGSALLPCVRAAQSGQICVPREHWRQIDPPELSPREKQVLGLVVMGLMNGQIAEQLFLAESTVKSHLSSAFGKLGVRSRSQAVKLILDPDRGLGMGILALGGEPVESTPTSQ